MTELICEATALIEEKDVIFESTQASQAIV